MLTTFKFSPDGRIIAFRCGSAVKLADVASRQEVATLSPPDMRVFEGLGFSRDGSLLAVSAMGVLQVWDLRQVRADLERIGLDWELPAYPQAREVDSHVPIAVDSQIQSGLRERLDASSDNVAPVDEDELVHRLRKITKIPLCFASMRSGDLDIYLADPVVGTMVNLTNNSAADSGPAWSPDGTQIAFESTRSGRYDIFVMNADGGNLRQITNTSTEDRMPVWSPDGRSLCFRHRTAENSPDWDLLVMNADGTDARNVTNHPDSDSDPAWSSRERIVFGSDRIDKRWTVFTMDPDGTDLRQIRGYRTGWFPHPCWSPDGNRLAFTAIHFNNRQISVMDADGRNERRLTNLKGLSILASWSPDGRHIAFMNRASDGDGTTASLYVMNSDGTDLTEVGPAEGHINGGRPAWKPLKQ